MAHPIGQQPYLNPGQREPFCSKVKTLAVIVAQLATRVLFIVASILIAAATLPLQFHAMIIPAVAFGATVLAGFFFPKPVHIFAVPRAELPRLLRPIPPRVVVPPVPPDLVQEAPRPVVRVGQNCWANSLVHFFNSDPLIAQWLRTPLPDNIDLAAFEQFLAGYEPDVAEGENSVASRRQAYAQVLVKFREYVNDPANPRATIPAMFQAFVNRHEAGPAYLREFKGIGETYTDLRKFQKDFADFFANYDQAILANRAVHGSQALRIALSRVTQLIDPDPGIQMDAAEPLGHVIDKLPNAQKAKISVTNTYDTRGLPPLLGYPEATHTLEKREPLTELWLDKEWTAPTLQQLLDYHSESSEVIEKKSIDGINRKYPTTVRRAFVEAPPVLRFQIVRFVNEKAPFSLLNYFKCWFWPELGHREMKRDTPVEVPENLTITLANGEPKQYRLTGFLNHHGPSKDSGHYTAARIVNGRKYMMDDEQVTLADPARWGEQLRRAYLLYYVAVQA
jgi:hypothetical protein